MSEIRYTEYTNRALNGAMNTCRQYRNEFVMPEHLLLALFEQVGFTSAFFAMNCNVTDLHREVMAYLMTIERVPEGIDYEPEASAQFGQMMSIACQQMSSASAERLDVTHLVVAMFHLDESMSHYILAKALNADVAGFMSELVSQYEDDEDGEEEAEPKKEPWRNLVTCLNETVDKHNPLIGRERELERTIQVLCRREKNNPLHVGEPGVGKTSLVYGLAARIVKGDVPARLRDCKIYQMDIGTMLAGTQYRGDFEKRIKQVMDGIEKEGDAIVYIDEIHNMVGAGRGTEGSLDASNLLKPYLESGDIRFIGSTTYDEYNRYFARSRGIVRRFQQIDILEPSVDESIDILKGLKKKYEKFHHVTYSPEAIEFAVRASAKYINDRFLPDKAVDLIDEAGAYREIHPTDKKTQKVDKTLVADILAKVCKVDAVAMKEDDNATLKTLESRIKAKIFGQDEAVTHVVEAVQMAKAGLLEENKPLASLLFVGPTGVGKTEVACVLAHELGIELVRFDMSEYTEKHTVAKLIGSPAGYVGYEDGGLLTDAIRKTPNCVLLLDEIEKAHQDIYNILLQVMDYARLTDNKGRHADFRNVVLIMTSNAGAQYASQASVGFNGNTSRGEAMLAQVKRTFKPEFINRLSGTVTFHDMDKQMATLIFDKKLSGLQDKLSTKNVTMLLSDTARELLLSKGFTREYGAREMDRVIAAMLKPLLMRQILFGKLKKGGRIIIDAANNELNASFQPILKGGGESGGV